MKRSASEHGQRDDKRLKRKSRFTWETIKTGSHPCTRNRCGAAVVARLTLGVRSDAGKFSRAAGGIVLGEGPSWVGERRWRWGVVA